MTRAKLALACWLVVFLVGAVALLAPAASAQSPAASDALCTPAWGSSLPAICI